jgi:hypothetical protein
MTQDSDTALTAIFEERAENLSRDELWSWSGETDRDRALLIKLKGSGAKLLSGPRGSGKSTLLRKAYFALLEEEQVLPVYVNFSRSLALEPLFHRQADALQIFRQWVVYKIVIGVLESLDVMGANAPETLRTLGEEGRIFIHDLETGHSSAPPRRLVAPSELLIFLEEWTRELDRTRCVLLLDDAAHAFSPAQQRDFFEVFRALRSKYVAAKAAVYPGITSYSPYFHVGHEAELLEAWYSPDDDQYLSTMRSVAKNRLPSSLYERFEGRPEIIDYLALASFGLPRGFLNMVSFALGVEEDGATKPTRRRAEQAVSAHAESVRNIFASLREKLPRFKRFVDVGLELQRSVAATLRSYNQSKTAGRDKTPIIVIADPIRAELDRILGMAEYAGMLRRVGSVSRGVKGVFHKYSLHYAIVIVENSLSLGKSFRLEDVIRSLSSTSAHAFVRSRPAVLLGPDYEQRCTLDLAPCQRCGAPRTSEDARFCMRCGAELREVSVYEELINAPIAKLPLTDNKLKGLTTHTSVRTVQDILLDEESKEIRKVPYVGPVWSARIRNAAQEYVSV